MPIPDYVFINANDDDGMPPLVDKDASAMTFTFTTDMTPITCSRDPTRLEILPDYDTAANSSSDLKGITLGSRSSHSKKRDASYIPRPPNAFILFRSSFIRSKQVPGKVEGNHSTLSKIVGMYWKTLPREEREIWEAKARVAQAEHRKRYPDWRFRPGANALLKLKIKDGGGGNNRKRNSQCKKAKDYDAQEKGSMQQRCAKIAGLLLEGKKGSALAAAVQAWECDGRNQEDHAAIGERLSEGDTHHQNKDAKMANTEHQTLEMDLRSAATGNPGVAGSIKGTARFGIHRCQTPNLSVETRFKIPLTSMFRRSLSAPASESRYACTDVKERSRTDTSQSSDGTRAIGLRPDQTSVSSGTMTSLAPPIFVGSPWPFWGNSLSYADMPASENVAVGYELAGSTASPLQTHSDPMDFGASSSVTKQDQPLHDGHNYISYQSSYSTLQGWAGWSGISQSWQTLPSDTGYFNANTWVDGSDPARTGFAWHGLLPEMDAGFCAKSDILHC